MPSEQEHTIASFQKAFNDEMNHRLEVPGLPGVAETMGRLARDGMLRCPACGGFGSSVEMRRSDGKFLRLRCPCGYDSYNQKETDKEKETDSAE